MRSIPRLSRPMLIAFAAIATPALTGCNLIDPLNRPYAWQPTNSIQHNLALMAADPHDLISGRGSPVRSAKDGALAVDHIWTEKPVPLLGGGAGGGGASSGGGSSGGGSSGGSGG